MRYVLVGFSLLGLAVGILSTVVTHVMTGQLRAEPVLHDPITPLLLSLASAVALLASSAAPGRLLHKPVVIVWLSVIVSALLIATLSVFFLWAAGDLYPVGDEAILEIYTLHAVRGFWALGPYSQFVWHHPGPLYFHLLAPFYLLSGQKTIALHVAAFSLNLLSLCGVAYSVSRYATSGVACGAVLALGVYLYRLEPVISSYWNPHIVILPAALYLVLVAAVAAGRHRALPLSVLVGSFLVQTHVSLGPYVVVLGSGALAAGASRSARMQTRDRSLRRWILWSTCLLVLLWLLPIAEETSHSPGNLTRIMHFFGASSPGQDWRTAFIVWGDMICALFKRDLALPDGSPLSLSPQTITRAGVCAILQVLLLVAACVDARRRQDRFVVALTAAGVIASMSALWSITRVKSLIGDYTIFWLSAVGALNWGVIGGAALTRVVGVRLRAAQQAAALGSSGLVVSGLLYFGSDQLKHVRRRALLPQRDSARVVQLASDAILADMRREHVQRPLFQMQSRDWATAAGVLLQVYKRHAPTSVEGSADSFFGEPLTPDGREDRVFVIGDPTPQATLATRAGEELLPNVERLSIHAAPLMKGQSLAPKSR